MPDPIIAPIVLGVAGNFATNVIRSQASNLRETKFGRSLAEMGLMNPSFSKIIEDSIATAAKNFLLENTSYNITEVHRFLESQSLSEKIRGYILQGKSPDIDGICDVLSQYVGFSLSEAPENWPNKINPWKLAGDLLSNLKVVFAKDANKGIIWISTQLADARAEIDRVRRELDLLPERMQEAIIQIDHSASNVFELSYLNHLSTRFQRLTTPGARELMGLQQSLDIAYISLNLTSGSGAEEARAEQFLGQNSKVVIRGPAGSGKTTLLNWITTQCASNRLNTASQWHGLVPFFIPLRKIARVETGAPTTARFLDYSVDEKVWTDEAPSGWLSNVLKTQQRAIVMIDGVDELPSPRRAEFWNWLTKFSEEYPGNRIIVTSRALPGTADGAKTEQWNPPRGFIEAKLQDMSNADVARFVKHWHDAIDSANLDTSEQQSLDEARRSLPLKLEDAANRRIRELCNTPLLCAMVCVLHWREEGYLPKIRVDLYDKCCEMLIEARDMKRGLEPPAGPLSALSKNDKEMVLQRLAFDMVSNKPDGETSSDDSYRIEISREKAVAWIGSKIASFQDPEARQAKASDVLNFLIERTGLLREPALDLIDFPHRTFQEYLAACAAGADSQEDLLAKQADDDQWHETIMLAAGTPTGGVPFGRRLIEALIKRGERHRSPRVRQQRIRKICFALALGCLENLRQHDPELRSRVLSNLGELVPPKNEQDSRILAVAGDAAVAYLEYSSWKDESTTTVAACARALRLIGTTEALNALDRGYREDHRESVVAEICRTGIFPYSKIPLVVSQVADAGRIPRFAETSDLELLVGLNGLRYVHIDGIETVDLSPLSRLSSINAFSATRLPTNDATLQNISSKLNSISLIRPSGNSIDFLKRLPELSIFELRGFDGMDFSGIENHPNLETLKLSEGRFDNLKFLLTIPNLKNVNFSELELSCGLGDIASMREIEQFVLSSCQIDNIEALNNISNLRCLVFEDFTGQETELGDFSQCVELNQVALAGMRKLRSLSAFSKLDNLESFIGIGLTDLENVDGFRGKSALRELCLVSSPKITSLPFEEMRRLERLQIGGIEAFKFDNAHNSVVNLLSFSISDLAEFDLHVLEQCSKLRKLEIEEIESLSGLGTLINLTDVSELKISRCFDIVDFDFIKELPIEHLSIHGLKNLRNLNHLEKMDSLRTLVVSDCQNIDDLTPLAGLQNLNRVFWYGDNNVKVPESLSPRFHRSQYYQLGWDDRAHDLDFAWYTSISNLPFPVRRAGIDSRYFYERNFRRRRVRFVDPSSV